MIAAPTVHKLSRGVLFLHDNASAHIARVTLRKIGNFGFELVDPPPYSPDLAPSRYHLFPQLKKHLKGTKFHSNSEVIAVAEARWEAQFSESFFQGLEKLEGSL